MDPTANCRGVSGAGSFVQDRNGPRLTVATAARAGCPLPEFCGLGSAEQFPSVCFTQGSSSSARFGPVNLFGSPRIRCHLKMGRRGCSASEESGTRTERMGPSLGVQREANPLRVYWWLHSDQDSARGTSATLLGDVPLFEFGDVGADRQFRPRRSTLGSSSAAIPGTVGLFGPPRTRDHTVTYGT